MNFRIWTYIGSAIMALILFSGCENPGNPFERSNIQDPVHENYNPGTITGLSAYFDNDGNIHLAWEDTARFESGYLVEKSFGTEDDFETIALLPENSFSYIDSTKNVREKTFYRVSTFTGEGDTKNVFPSEPILLPIFFLRDFTKEFNAHENVLNINWSIDSPFLSQYVLSSGHLITENESVITVQEKDYTHIDPLIDIGFENRVYRLQGILDIDESSTIVFDTTITFNVMETFSPSDFEVSIVNESLVSLQWNDNSYFESGYRIYRRDGYDFHLLAEMNAGSTSFLDEDLIENPGNRIYKLEAFKDNQVSIPIEGQAFFNIGLPTLLPQNDSNISPLEIHFDISINAPHLVKEFIIYRSEVDNYNFVEIDRIDGNETQFTDTQLTGNNQYFYRIRSLSTENRQNNPNSSQGGDRRVIYGPNYDKLASLIAHTTNSKVVSSIDVSPDGNFLISAAALMSFQGDNLIKIWDLNSFTLYNTISSHDEVVNSVKIHPNGNYMISSSMVDRNILIHTFPHGELVDIEGDTDDFSANYLSFSNDGTYVAGTNPWGRIIKWKFTDMSMKFFDTNSGPTGYYYNDLAFSNNGNYIAGNTNRIVILDANTGETLHQLGGNTQEFSTAMTFSRNDEYLFFIRSNGVLNIFRTSDWSLIRTVSYGFSRAIDLHPLLDNQLISVSGNVIVEYDFLNNQYVNTYRFPEEYQHTASIKFISPDRFAVGYNDGYVRIFQRSDQKSWRQF